MAAMVPAAMAAASTTAAALGTQSTSANTTRLLPTSIPNSSVRSPASPSIAVLRNCSSLRSSGTSWNCGSLLEGQKLQAKEWYSKKKCGVAVAAVGQRQAARDMVVEFGKFKGAMMGTLSSKYLKWMVKNLQSGPLSEWSAYAEEVLADSCYKDRLEWEKVEQLMIAAHDVRSVTGNRDAVLAPAKMYGWDLQDDVAWRKVNFSLIGTSEGGRIPRVKGDGVPLAVPEKKKPAPRRKKSSSIGMAISTTSIPSTSSTTAPADDSSSSGSLREELMHRRAQRRDRRMTNRGSLSGDDEAGEVHQVLSNKFPGRESLLKSVRAYDISE